MMDDSIRNERDERQALDSYVEESRLAEVGATRADAPQSDGRRRTGDHAPLFASDEFDRFQARWRDIQTSFVDEPRRAVEEANQLVGEVTDRLMATFDQMRGDLERQWSAGDEVSTENLRRAFQRYRALFERFLAF